MNPSKEDTATLKSLRSSSKPKVKLRAEFKPLLSSTTISFEFDRHVISSSLRLEVTNHSIQLAAKDWTVVFSIKNLTLRPPSCRNLCWISPQELQLTLLATWTPELSESGDGSTTLSDFSNGVKNTYEPFRQDHLVTRIQKCHPHCYCVGCGAQILNPSCRFKRVLPLPSENWSDFADIWFCHHHHTNGENHVNNNTKICDPPDLDNNHELRCGENTVPENLQHAKSTGLLPRPDDCLVSSLYMMVSARHVNPRAITCSVDQLVCKRCGNFLGFVKLGDVSSCADETLNSYLDDPLNGVYKIYFHTVSFSEDGWDVGPRMLKIPHNPHVNDGMKPREQSVEDFICSLLKDQSRVFTSFRFILHSSPCQGNSQSGLDMLLWLLDQELYLYSSTSDVPVSKTNTKRSSASHSTDEDKTISSLSLKSSQSSQTAAESKAHSRPVSFIKLHPCKYMKILYKVDFWPSEGIREMPPPEVFNDWQKDNTVHGLSLPHPLCQQLLSLLISSTSQLNTHQQSLNGFHVGYLRAS
ncbi:E3 ubiquitin-protein ligase e3d-like [Plakobranchus ocellatus]|uniref:E3 ubiquitin-protein ligase E3D n=1 Tax=Plakobranchus ocellatus TaxID=259542 RepID=A0AAV4D9N2_9GAST|nr:E3 ubiquitin-protein ligase e3d-like [Plakobranchus ocellatus]